MGFGIRPGDQMDGTWSFENMVPQFLNHWGSCFKTDQTTLLTFADYIVSLCVFADPNLENQIKVTIQSEDLHI